MLFWNRENAVKRQECSVVWGQCGDCVAEVWEGANVLDVRPSGLCCLYHWPRKLIVANRCRSPRGVVSTSSSFVADEFFHMVCCIISADTGGQIAVNPLKLQRRYCSRARQRCQAWTCWFGAGWSSCLATSVGQELLLIEVHLSLRFVLAVVGAAPWRERRLRTVRACDWRRC